MKHYLKRMIALTLVIAMTSNFVLESGAAGIANEMQTSESTSQTADSLIDQDSEYPAIPEEEEDSEETLEVLYELEDLRQENVKQYRLNNGEIALAEYNMEVHYLDENGEWEDIDNRFLYESAENESDIDGFSTVAGASQFKFAARSGQEDLVQLTKDDYSVGLQFISSEYLSAALEEDESIDSYQEQEIQPSEITIIDGDVLNADIALQAMMDYDAKSQEIIENSDDEKAMEEVAALDSKEESVDNNDASEKMSLAMLDEEESLSDTEADLENVLAEDNQAAEEPAEDVISEDSSLVDMETDVEWVETGNETVQIDTEEMSSLCEQMKVPNAISSVGYKNIMPGISLQYITYGNSLKEYILVNQQYETYQYAFQMSMDGLYAETQEDGSILLMDVDTGEAVYEIPHSYMEDAAGAYSDAVSMELIQDGEGEYVLLITADEEWINDESRVFPVQIDPTMNTMISSLTDIRGVYISSLKPTVSTVNTGAMFVGYDSSEMGKMRTYIQLRNLPSLPNDSVLCGAYFYGYVRSFSDCEMGSLIVDAKQVTSTSTWTDKYTWNNKPTVSSVIVDYQTITASKKGSYIGWNITSLLKAKYESNKTSEITAFELSAKLESSMTSTYAANASIRLTASSAYPILQVLYRDTKGVEDYFTYQTQSIGYAGTGYVGDYTSQLTLSEADVSYESTALSYTLSHVYNSAYGNANFTSSSELRTGNYSTMNLGTGWKLSAQETIQSVSITNLNSTTTYLVYTDGDGTEHYFQKDSSSSTTYKDEDGLNLTITVSGSNYTMKDQKDNVRYFTNGYLTYIADANGNKIYIVYNGGTYTSNTPSTTSGNKITSIVSVTKGASSATTIATLSYNSYNQLTSITDYAGRTIAYTYSGTGSTAKLIKITQFGTNVAQYQYNTNGRLTHAFDLVTKTGIQYEYSSSATGYEITAFHEYSASSISATQTVGQSVSCSKTDLLRKVYTDSGTDRVLGTADDIITTYLFNNSAQTINVSSADKAGNLLGATASAYTTSSGTSKKNNRISSTVSTGQAGINLLTNGSFESYSGTTATGWVHDTSSGGQIAARSQTAHSGSMRYNLYSASSSLAPSIYQTAALTGGKTYTVSAYVNTGILSNTIATGGGVYLQIRNASGSIIATGDALNYQTSTNIDDGWQRITLTFTPNSSGNYQIRLVWYHAVGTVCVDDIQLEAGDTASSYNLVSNGSFESGSSDWTLSSSNVAVSSSSSEHGSKSIQFTGNSTALYQARQTIQVNKSGNTTFMLSAWSKANSAPDLSQTKFWDDARYWGLVIQINYSDGTVQTACLTFQEGITDWQYNSIAVVPKYPEKTISTMKVFCCYYNEVNTAYFDNISLVEEPAETYTYDDNGNVIAVNAAGNGEETYSYNSTTQNLMSVATAGSGTYTYAYGNTNNTHLVTKVTNDTVSMGITYDSLGEATQTKLTNTSDSTYMTSSAAYSNGLLTSVTDNTGATTSYTYNNRQISAEKNANGVTVNTTYNALALPSLTYQSGKISLNYTYTNGLISQIQKGGYISGNSTKQLQSYNFTYDYFGNRTNIAVGTRTLASYAYGSNDGNLSTLTYGNGDSVKYSYDSLDRVKKVEYSKSGDSYEYSYDGNDQLAVVVDNQTGDTYHYTYDSLGRLIYSNIVSNGAIGLYTSHEYDTSNRIVAQSWQIGSDKFTEQYTYSSTDGTLTEMTTGGIPNSYSYDNLKRLSHRINSVMRVGYSYVTSGNKTTSQVSSIGITTLSGSSIATLGYSYDALGNITKVTNTAGSTETYTYDTQNQLTAATIGSTSYAYTYDTYGNIRTATRGSTTHTYTYGDNEWLDLLTAYDGNSITYDTIGNPLSYYNGTRWTLTWQNGRQLAKAVKSGRTLSYTYDASGMVSSKTVTSSGSTLQCTYTVLDGKVVREVRGSYIINYSYDENGRPFKISIVTGSATYEGYYVLNLQGDVIKIVDSSGNSLVSYAYDPWGKFTGSSTSTLGEMLLDYNCLTYRGYYYDEYIGMYYLQSRFYDPNIGRFINADAADYADLAAVSLSETNLFAYCGNNPVACKDPTGEFLLDGLSVVAAAGIAGVIAGGIWGGISAAMTGGDFYAIIGGMAFGAATGGLAGAACALTSVSVGLRVLCGATLGVINYCYTTDVEDSTASGFITSAVLGGATMAIGVALPSVSSIPINFAGTYLLSGVSSVGTSIVNTIASTSKSKSKKASNVTSAGSAVHNMHRSFSRGLRHVTYVNSGKTAGIQLSHQYSKVSLMYG